MFSSLLPFNCKYVAFSLVGMLCLGFARADIYELESGGKIQGVLLDRGADGHYKVQTAQGAVVSLTRDQIKRIVPQEPAELEYQQLSQAKPDTLQAHRQLAQWCKEHGLSDLAEHHHRRILHFDPRDETARLALGFQKHQGQWMTREEIMEARGLVYYEGDYRTPQDIALREQAKQETEAQSDWYRKLRLWRDWLDSRHNNRVAEAMQNIESIRDPLATSSLLKMLEREENQEVYDLLLRTLAGLDHPEVIRKLVELSLHDASRGVRLDCLGYLIDSGKPISLTPYVKALESKDNDIVNRAAYALEQLGNPEAISPLIDALVTRHKFIEKSGPPGQISAGFSSSSLGGGGGGLSTGNKRKVFHKDLENLDVRSALRELSGGQDFGFNEQAWRRWFVNQQIRDFVDARRDR